MSRTLQDVIDAINNGTEQSTTDRSFLKKEFRLKVLLLLNPTVAHSVTHTTKSDVILNLIQTELKNLEAVKAAASAATIAAAAAPFNTVMASNVTATATAATNGNPGLFTGSQQQLKKARIYSSVVASTAGIITMDRNLPTEQQDSNIVDLIMYTFKQQI